MYTKIYQIGTNTREYRRKTIRNCTLTAIIVGVIMLVFMALSMNALNDYYTNEMNAMTALHNNELAQMAQQHEAETRALREDRENRIMEYNTLLSMYDELRATKDADSKHIFELGRKYWYVFKDAPDNSGLTMDDIIYQDELAKEKNLNPHIMWCIYDIESNYTARIDNKTSSARGIGQVLASTGKSLYENILQLGTYQHTMAYDAETNMTLATELITRNIDNGLYNAIVLYSGDSSGEYYNKVLTMAQNHGVSINDISYQ